MTSAVDLPAPSSAAQRVSDALTAQIRDEIERAGGWLDFARYMELALYAPGLGYYSAGSAKFGAAGDFITAPELGDLLGRALAGTLRGELAAFESAVVLELGAGSGALAAQLLDSLAAAGDERIAYWILEPSADLRARQQAALQRFGARVQWLDTLPATPFDGAIVANEVLDALPVSRFVKRGGAVRPLGVSLRGGRFELVDGPARADLSAAVAAIEAALDVELPEGYRSEICPALPAWIAALRGALRGGCMLFVDYGLVRREYYHEQRSDGTLMCHYRHRAHADPFLYPGLQDITAWVDFSACADAAHAVGLVIAGFTTQAQFLLSTLAVLPPSLALDRASLSNLSALKTLMLPGEMGERFKVLLLRTVAEGGTLPGRDFRSRL